MEIYLPIAGMSINFFLILGIGGLVGFLSGLFGVGGGFLLTPLMMMIGIPPAVAAASDSNQIVAGASSGAFAHWRLGNVDFKMGLVILAGGIFGGTIGVQLVKVLRAVGNFEFVMKVIYVLMLGLVGGAMFIESWRTIRRSKSGEAAVGEEMGGNKLGQMFSKTAFKDELPPLRHQYLRHLPLRHRHHRGHHGGPAGRGRRLHHGAGHDLYHRHAHHRRHRHRPLSDRPHLRQRHLAASLGEQDRGPAAGLNPALRLHHRGPVRGHRRPRLKGEQIRILLAAIVLILAVKIFFDLILTPSDLVSLAPVKGGH